MTRAPVGKFKLWTGQPVNAPFVTAPVGLRFIMLLCVASITATLILGVMRQLAPSGVPDESNLGLIVISGFGFIVPILNIVAIETNRPQSRPLCIAYSAYLAYLVIKQLLLASLDESLRAYLVTAMGLLWIGVVYWIYRSARMRIYYALITAHPMPTDLIDRADKLTSPGRLETLLGRFSNCLGNYAEIVAVLVILAFVVLAWANMSVW